MVVYCTTIYSVFIHSTYYLWTVRSFPFLGSFLINFFSKCFKKFTDLRKKHTFWEPHSREKNNFLVYLFCVCENSMKSWGHFTFKNKNREHSPFKQTLKKQSIQFGLFHDQKGSRKHFQFPGCHISQLSSCSSASNHCCDKRKSKSFLFFRSCCLPAFTRLMQVFCCYSNVGGS